MMRHKWTLMAVSLLVLISVVLILVSGCLGDESQGVNVSNGEVEQLEPVEIREYEGINLSSVDGFRENSIKGPQQVDIESYRLEITGLVQNPRSYTYDEVINNRQYYKKVVTLDCVEG